MIIYLNGSYVPLEKAGISPMDRGFLLGDGIFETIYVANQQPECLAAHEKRLRLSAKALSISYPEDINFAEIITNLIHKNQLITAAVRITVTRGVGERGLTPQQNPRLTILITAFSYQRPTESVTLMTATERLAIHRLLGVKHLGYQQAILARMEAQAKGYDEALFINKDDHVVSATCANVFVKIKKGWITPPIQSGARPGVMRGRILVTGQARVDKVTVFQMQEQAEAMVITNSLIGIQVVKRLDHKLLNLDQAEEFKEKLRPYLNVG